MVLFVTGLCNRKCFYCPVSFERKDKDLIFANERLVEKDEDIIEEALSMDALGTGITGGEPILKPERVKHYIKLLKKQFGKEHHIHLYTSLAPGKNLLRSLKEAGLDEIRFHPPIDLWKDINNTPYRKSIIAAHELGISTGVELPSISEDLKGILSLLEEVDGFLNLNELEFSETNSEELKKHGFVVAEDGYAAVGSREAAEKLSFGRLHFCSSRFKDAVQLRERFKRIAKRNARDFDEITEDGTLVYGVIEGDGLPTLKKAKVAKEMYSKKNGFIETAWWIAEELADEMKKSGCSVCVIERYPMQNGFVVEKTPL